MAVDDPIVFEERLKGVVTENFFDVVGLASNGVDTVAMDLTLPEMDGIECVSRFVCINVDII